MGGDCRVGTDYEGDGGFALVLSLLNDLMTSEELRFHIGEEASDVTDVMRVDIVSQLAWEADERKDCAVRGGLPICITISLTGSPRWCMARYLHHSPSSPPTYSSPRPTQLAQPAHHFLAL